MDTGFILNKKNPLRKSNIFSKLCFVWMIKFFYKTVKHGLRVTDMYETLDCDKSKKLGDILEKNWKKEVERCRAKNWEPSLLRAICATFLWRYMAIGIMVFLQFVIFRASQPVVLSYLINRFSSGKKDDTTINEMWISGSLLIAITIVAIFLNHHSMSQQMYIGMRIRVAVCSLVYRKLLRLNKKALREITSGQVINLLSNDVNRFDAVIVGLHHLWIAPFLIAITTFLMWQQVEVAAFACVGSIIVFTIPFQLYVGKKSKDLRLTIATRTDFRIRLMNEIMSGIQVIKMYAWEKPFEKLVHEARRREMVKITVVSYLKAIYQSTRIFVEKSSLFFTVICYVLMGNTITADKVFSISQFCNTLQLSLAVFFPLAIAVGGETLVSLRRLKSFLILDEKEEPLIEYNNSLKEININSVNAAWSDEKPTLQNFYLKIPSGSLCAVVGPVGSGKSSLLNLLLGELPMKSGSVNINSEISYASQEAWLFGASVRNNILFGREYNQHLYRNVVKVCALVDDFKQFPYGDQTRVEERGISLSGGQRARINLARAVYRNADIYLFDDPLSAVDIHVGKHLFEECIQKHLSGKTRILVTHQLHYLKTADIIVVINNGMIEANGTFEELSRTNFNFMKMLVSADESIEKNDDRMLAVGNLQPKRVTLESSAPVMSHRNDSYQKTQPTVEEEEIGIKKGSAVWEYLKAGGGVIVVIILFIVFIAGQAACSGSDYWVTYWTEEENLRHQGQFQHLHSKNKEEKQNRNYSFFNIFTGKTLVDEDGYLATENAVYVYTVIIISAVFLVVLRSLLFFQTCMRASKNLHKNMFHCLLQAPMRFFNTNPSGRILNRFSKDMGAIDELLPRACIEAMQIVLAACGTMVIIAISNPYMIILMVILFILFIFLKGWYLATVKLIKHIEGITKSPMFSHVNSSLNGIATIRSCKAEAMLIDEFDHHQDAHSSAWFLTITSMISFGLWLDILLTIFITAITYSFILIYQYSDQVRSSMVSLGISQSLILTGMLQYGVRQTAEAITQMASVERVLQYTQLDKEGPFDTPKEKMPPQDWPKQGRVIFDHISLKYTPNAPLVLKDLNLTVHPGEKIGIVGRTGAGKSSLISTLFRLANIDGNIILDDIDTKTVGLTDLRKRVSIIPQEPVLFSETLRYNLDPFNEYEDRILWNALKDVELKDKVQRLEYMVEGGGANFSLGERQLICLARAIVRNNKILILDEATANVDPETDSLIQATIRRKFATCTVLTIAHRLNTIMDSDRVLVLDAGCILEFDHPHLLLQNEDGVFTSMLNQTGPTMTQTLRDIAAKAYENNNLSKSH